MSDLAGKKVLLGVCGGIAAYKVAELARLLVKAGADVKVMMTESGQKFVTPLTFRTLTGNPVATTLWSDPGSPFPHISMSDEADLIRRRPRHREHHREDGGRHRGRPSLHHAARGSRHGYRGARDEHPHVPQSRDSEQHAPHRRDGRDHR